MSIPTDPVDLELAVVTGAVVPLRLVFYVERDVLAQEGTRSTDAALADRAGVAMLTLIRAKRAAIAAGIETL